MSSTTTQPDKARMCDIEDVMVKLENLRKNYCYNQEIWDVLTEAIDIVDTSEVYDK